MMKGLSRNAYRWKAGAQIVKTADSQCDVLRAADWLHWIDGKQARDAGYKVKSGSFRLWEQ